MFAQNKDWNVADEKIGNEKKVIDSEKNEMLR